MSDDPGSEFARLVARLTRRFSTWALVVAFVVLAVLFALAGKLDDWLRVAAAVTFGVIALALFMRALDDRPPST